MPILSTPPLRRLLAILATAMPLMALAAPQKIEGLGALEFPTSTSSTAAQTEFVRGMLLLHLFQYAEAEEAFKEAAKRDPGMTMAYWGEAMTANHPIWNRQNREQALAALKKLGDTPEARQAKAANAKEKAWLHSLEVLYGEGGKEERDVALLKVMQKMARDYPQDNEVQLFYALALLGVEQGNRNLANFDKAAQIARRVFKQNPQHPGAAHYWIHGMDDARHASGAMEAAQALSKIAPRADHAQHMTSHIFIALGMWPEVIAANLAGMQVLKEEREKKGLPFVYCGHYAEWLHYAYLQQGQEKMAQQLLTSCLDSARVAEEWYRQHPEELSKRRSSLQRFGQNQQRAQATMLGMHWVEMAGREDETRKLSFVPAGIERDIGWFHFSRGYAAAKSAELAPAKAALSALQALQKQAPAKGEDIYHVQYLLAMEHMLHAAILAAEGERKAALKAALAAVAIADKIPVEFGPPAMYKLPEELLADIYLADQQFAAAAQAYRQTLQRAPQRAWSMHGLAQALTLGKQESEAAQAWANWRALRAHADQKPK